MQNDPLSGQDASSVRSELSVGADISVNGDGFDTEGLAAVGFRDPGISYQHVFISYDEKPETLPVGFLRHGSKWHRHLNAQEEDGHRLWEVAVFFHLRDAFRSGDIWLSQSRRYGDLKQALVPRVSRGRRISAS